MSTLYEQSISINVRIQTLHPNSKREIIMAVHISKCFRKYFLIIKPHHSRSNSFHTVFIRMYGVNSFVAQLG